MQHYLKIYKKLETLGCFPSDASVAYTSTELLRTVREHRPNCLHSPCNTYEHNLTYGYIVSVTPELTKQTYRNSSASLPEFDRPRFFRFNKYLHKRLGLRLNNHHIKGSTIQLTCTQLDATLTQGKLQFSHAAAQLYKKHQVISKVDRSHFLGCLFITTYKPLFISGEELQHCFVKTPRRSLRVFRETCSFPRLKKSYLRMANLLKLALETGKK